MVPFKKTSLALIAAGALISGNVLAGEQATIYGKVNATVQSDDTGESETNIKSNASRVGIKGGVKINDDLKAIYKVEWQVDVSDESKSDNISARSQWVGLKGNFGAVMIGRNDTALKKSQGKVDLFSDLNGDIKQLFSGENRMGDSLTYVSPKFSGFSVAGTFIAEEGNSDENGTSLALMYGDAKLKKSSLYAALAHDADVKGVDTTRVTINGKVGGVKLGAMWNESEKAGKKGDGYLVSAAYGIGKTTLKLQYQDSDDVNGKAKQAAEMVTLGADYKLAKNVKVFGFYTDTSFADNSDASHLALGMEYKF
mgnify:CR=1 FL=1